MKRLAFLVSGLAFLLTVMVVIDETMAKDAGPKPAAKKAAPKKVAPKKAEPKKKVEPKPAPKKAKLWPPAKKAATTKKVEVKPDVKVVPKKTPKAAVPASKPAKSEVKVAGKVEIKEEEVKLDPPPEGFDLWDALYGIYTNFKEGKVWDGVALLLMVLTFVFFKVKKDLPIKYAVWIAAGLGIATNIVSAILGGVGWGPALTAGLFQGAAAGGFWTMVGKHIFRSRVEKDKRAKAREIAVEKGLGS
jgi:hypothetical protein